MNGSRRAVLTGAACAIGGFGAVSLYDRIGTRTPTGETAKRSPDQYRPQRLPWGVERVGAAAVHSREITGVGARVAVVGTGVDGTHPDLRSNTDTGTAVGEPGDRPGSDLPSWQDRHGHGTHMAGIVAAVDNGFGVVGVAPDATIYPVRILAVDGEGSSERLAEGIRRAVDHGVDIVNLSVRADGHTPPLESACRQASEQGVLVVAAAGNDRNQHRGVSYPARYDSVVSVGAVTTNDSIDRSSAGGPGLDVVAPGANVLSTVPGGYATHSGTSTSAAHVAGSAALLVSTGLDPRSAGTHLVESAEDLGVERRRQGAGLVRIDAAIGT